MNFGYQDCVEMHVFVRDVHVLTADLIMGSYGVPHSHAGLSIHIG